MDCIKVAVCVCKPSTREILNVCVGVVFSHDNNSAREESSMHVWELYLAMIITQRIPAHAVTVHPVLVYAVSRREEDTCTFSINSNSNCRDHRSTLLSVHCCSCCTVARQHCAASTPTRTITSNQQQGQYHKKCTFYNLQAIWSK